MSGNISVKISEIISGPAAIIVLIAFFLPWVTISCSTTEITYTGYDLAKGVSSDEDVPSSAQNEADSDELLYGIPLAGLAALGVAISRTRGKTSSAQARLTYIAAGVIGLILQGLKYAALQSDLSDAEEQVGAGVIKLTYEIGWWLTGLSLLAIIVAAFLTSQGEPSPAYGPQGYMGGPPPPGAYPPPPGSYPPPPPPPPST